MTLLTRGACMKEDLAVSVLALTLASSIAGAQVPARQPNRSRPPLLAAPKELHRVRPCSATRRMES